MAGSQPDLHERSRCFHRWTYSSVDPRPSVSIRLATLEDAVPIWHVLQAAVTPLTGRFYTSAQIQAWVADEAPRNFARYLAAGETVFVAEHRQRVIGFSRLNRMEIEALYVHPARSRHRIGELMLRAVERFASNRQIERLHLDAAINAVPFYESNGYRVLGPSMPTFDNGVPLPCVRMGKTLGAASEAASFGPRCARLAFRGVVVPAVASLA